MKKIDPLTLVLTFALVTPTGYLLAGPTSPESYAQETLPDDSISEQVRTALGRDPSLLSTPLKVETYRGTVHLAGSVYTHEQLVRAENIASRVAGVREVHSRLQVKSTMTAGERVAGI